ncbi:acyl-CoA thioesterase [Candidatus Kaiserbacteria bacterium]|nr:acyl-CoA thioesterase [Candidatus Kaiserbacteria bacterium]
MTTHDIPPKTVAQSVVDGYCHLIFGNDMNARNTVFGGRIMEIADKLAGIVAMRHSQMDCVTLSADSFRFLGPAILGEVLIFNVAINRAWGTSMEVGVKVYAQKTEIASLRHIVSAYFTLVTVSVDECGVRKKLPRIIPETPDEKRRFEEAQVRRDRRLQEDHEKRKK